MTSDQDLGNSIAFFLGAGASKPAGLPTMAELSARLMQRLHVNSSAKGQTLAEKHNVTEVVKRLKKHPRCASQEHFDFEVFMEALYSCQDRNNYSLYHLADPASYMLFDEPDSLMGEIHSFVLDQVSNIGTLNHLRFLEYAQEDNSVLNIFTTNYDKCLELYCERNSLFYTVFNPLHLHSYSVGDDNPTAHSHHNYIYKLHGSVLWRINSKGEYYSVSPLDDNDSLAIADKPITDRLLVFPAVSKQLTNDPFLTLHRHFQDILSSIKLLIVVGYAFNDPYILDILYSHCRRNKEFPIIVIDPNGSENMKMKSSILKQRYGTNDFEKHFLCFDMSCETFSKRNVFNIMSKIDSIYNFGLIEEAAQYMDEYHNDPAFHARKSWLNKMIRLEKANEIGAAASTLSFLNMRNGEMLFENTRDYNIEYVYCAIRNLMQNTQVRYLSETRSTKETNLFNVLTKYLNENIIMLLFQIQHRDRRHMSSSLTELVYKQLEWYQNINASPHKTGLIEYIMKSLHSILVMSLDIRGELERNGSQYMDYDAISRRKDEIRDYVNSWSERTDHLVIESWIHGGGRM